jgi:hypothetical protein
LIEDSESTVCGKSLCRENGQNGQALKGAPLCSVDKYGAKQRHPKPKRVRISDGVEFIGDVLTYNVDPFARSGVSTATQKPLRLASSRWLSTQPGTRSPFRRGSFARLVGRSSTPAWSTEIGSCIDGRGRTILLGSHTTKTSSSSLMWMSKLVSRPSILQGVSSGWIRGAGEESGKRQEIGKVPFGDRTRRGAQCVGAGTSLRSKR